ncbi:MAG: hypothetical protein LWY06_17460 [Firmicutes bacterium]|nr:hypothetical protein [Bacillota bacterium]
MDRIGSQQPVNYDNSVAARVKKDIGAVKEGVQTALDVFVPGANYSSVEINTDIPEYKNVTTEEAAKMIGYFTQIMEQKGFPWALYEPKTGIFGTKSKKAIGEFEALKRIKKANP